MRLRFSETLITLMLLLLFYGCTQRYDYAPVIHDDQRYDGYHVDNSNQNRKPIVTNQSPPPVIEQKPPRNNPKRTEIFQQQNEISRRQTANPLADIRPAIARYHEVKEGETLFSIGTFTGYGIENLAKWNRIDPPYRVQTGQKIKLFDPIAVENPAAMLNKPTNSSPVLNSGFSNKSINSSNNKTKDELKSHAGQLKQEIKGKIKEKSIISIDNRNMLMLNFQWPIKGKIHKNFSQTDKKGIEIVGKLGQTVRAAEAGKVVYSGQGLIGFGNLLIIKHNSAFLSAYANNGVLFVKEGQQVKKGQGIAKAGVALSKKAFLHFEIRKNGKTLDPLTLLPKMINH